MTRNDLVVTAAAALVLAFSTPASADIVSGVVTGGTADGAVFVQLTPPLANPFGPANSVGDDNFQSPNLMAFAETQNVQVSSPIAVNVGSAPAVGTWIDSYYVFFDPGPTESVIGNVNFNTQVLAIITSTGNLLASDFLGAAGVNYLDPGARGLESGDSVTINPLDHNQIIFNTTASTPGDYVRVLTVGDPPSAVPEPASWSLLGIIAIGTGAMFYRRRRTC